MLDKKTGKVTYDERDKAKVGKPKAPKKAAISTKAKAAKVSKAAVQEEEKRVVISKNDVIIGLLQKKQANSDPILGKKIRRQLRKRGFYLSRQEAYRPFEKGSITEVIKGLEKVKAH